MRRDELPCVATESVNLYNGLCRKYSLTGPPASTPKVSTEFVSGLVAGGPGPEACCSFSSQNYFFLKKMLESLRSDATMQSGVTVTTGAVQHPRPRFFLLDMSVQVRRDKNSFPSRPSPHKDGGGGGECPQVRQCARSAERACSMTLDVRKAPPDNTTTSHTKLCSLHRRPVKTSRQARRTRRG